MSEDQRVRTAREVLAGYDKGRWTAEVNLIGFLAASVRQLLEVIDGATAPLPAGAALSAADLMTVLGALHDAAHCGDAHGQFDVVPGPAAVAAYRSLSRSLGDDRD